LEEYLESNEGAKIKLWVFDIDEYNGFLEEFDKDYSDRIELIFFDLNNYGLEEYLLNLWRAYRG
jgi:hypothetical protein